MENCTKVQRMRSVLHAICGMDNNGTRTSPECQHVPAYSGFQSCCQYPPEKSKPYYHTTYLEPPTKSILYDMLKLTSAMEQKQIPLSFLVGDMTTYKLILQLKSESPDRGQSIILILGAFHLQMSYMYAIYKIFKGLGMEIH